MTTILPRTLRPGVVFESWEKWVKVPEVHNYSYITPSRIQRPGAVFEATQGFVFELGVYGRNENVDFASSLHDSEIILRHQAS